MDKMIQTSEGGRTVQFTRGERYVEIAADGFGPILLGFPNCKLSLYSQQIQSDSDGPIERELVATIAIPVANILELADNIRNSFRQNRGLFEGNLAKITRAVLAPVNADEDSPDSKQE